MFIVYIHFPIQCWYDVIWLVCTEQNLCCKVWNELASSYPQCVLFLHSYCGVQQYDTVWSGRWVPFVQRNWFCGQGGITWALVKLKPSVYPEGGSTERFIVSPTFSAQPDHIRVFQIKQQLEVRKVLNKWCVH